MVAAALRRAATARLSMFFAAAAAADVGASLMPPRFSLPPPHETMMAGYHDSSLPAAATPLALVTITPKTLVLMIPHAMRSPVAPLLAPLAIYRRAAASVHAASRHMFVIIF